MKTKLEIIDETIEHIRQNGFAYVDGACSYCTKDGRKCAVGRCLINPAGVQHDFGGQVASRIVGLELKLMTEYRGHSTGFWDQLQSLHDQQEEYWAQKKTIELTPMGEKAVQNLKYDASAL